MQGIGDGMRSVAQSQPAADVVQDVLHARSENDGFLAISTVSCPLATSSRTSISRLASAVKFSPCGLNNCRWVRPTPAPARSSTARGVSSNGERAYGLLGAQSL
jgi:hypothetical protein